MIKNKNFNKNCLIYSYESKVVYKTDNIYKKKIEIKIYYLRKYCFYSKILISLFFNIIKINYNYIYFKIINLYILKIKN